MSEVIDRADGNSLDAIADQKKNLGNEKYKEKNYAGALESYSEAILYCPQNATYYGNRSACYMMLSKYKEGLEDARSAVRLDPYFWKGFIRIAKCCLAMGDLIGTEQAINQVLQIKPDCDTIQTDRSLVEELKRLEKNVKTHYDSKAYRRALFYIDSALKIASACTKYHLLKAECLVFLDRVEESLDIALKCMKSDSSSAEAVYIRGLCLYYTDDLEKALNHFGQALLLDPEHQKAKAMRLKTKTLKDAKDEADHLYKEAKYENAKIAYERALKIDPLNKFMNAKLFFNLALVLSKMKDINAAVENCSNALKINPKYVKALLLRARCYSDLQKYESCVQDYETLLGLEKTAEVKRLLREAKVALKRSKRKDYYKILGLSSNADLDDIKKAYRKKALVHHPDRHASKSPEERLEEEIKFKEIGEAYSTLSDPTKRRRYDSGLDLEDANEVDASNIYRTFMFSQGSGTSFQFSL